MVLSFVSQLNKQLIKCLYLSVCLSWLENNFWSLSVMSVAASDEEGSDEKQSVIRRRTITGGMTSPDQSTPLLFVFEGLRGLRGLAAQEEVASLGSFPPLTLTRTLTRRPLTPLPRREAARRNSSNTSRISPRKSAPSVSVLRAESVVWPLTSLCYSVRHLLCSGGRHPAAGPSVRHPQLHWVPF